MDPNAAHSNTQVGGGMMQPQAQPPPYQQPASFAPISSAPPSSAPPSNTAPAAGAPGSERQFLVTSRGGVGGLQDKMRLGMEVWDAMPKWHVTLKDSFIPPTSTLGVACCCPQWFAYQQRKDLLAFTNEPNSCCLKDSIPRAGNCCCARYDPPIRGWPATWPMQPPPAVQTSFQLKICYANRQLMHHRFHVIESKEDVALMAATACCCFCCRNDTDRAAAWTLSACLQTQQDNELKWHIQARRALNASGTPGYQVWEPQISAAPDVQIMADDKNPNGPPRYTGQGHIVMQMRPDAQSTATATTAPNSRAGSISNG